MKTEKSEPRLFAVLKEIPEHPTKPGYVDFDSLEKEMRIENKNFFQKNQIGTIKMPK